MYSYGPLHMAVQKQDDQHEHTFSSYVRIRDVVLKTYLGRWTIGRSGKRGPGISVLPARYDDGLSFRFLSILLCGQQRQQSPQFCKFSFILLNIIRSGRLAEIKWFVCISKSLILLDWCWVVHIPFVCWFKFKFLALFPVDHLGHPVVSSLVLFLWQFATFIYVIDGFVSVTT